MASVEELFTSIEFWSPGGVGKEGDAVVLQVLPGGSAEVPACPVEEQYESFTFLAYLAYC